MKFQFHVKLRHNARTCYAFENRCPACPASGTVRPHTIARSARVPILHPPVYDQCGRGLQLADCPARSPQR